MSSKLDSNQVLPAAFDDQSNSLNVKGISGLVTESYDNLEISYITTGNGVGEVGQVKYKAGSVVVATLTLAYDSDSKVISVVRS